MAPHDDVGRQPGHRWAIFALLCLGAFLRVHNFWGPDLWLDEYGSWWTLATGDWRDVVVRANAIGTQSALYYLLVMPFTLVLGPSSFSLRLPSVLFGLGALGLTYPLASRTLRDPRAALMALAVFAVNPTLIFYSQEARPYALALFCAVLSFLCYLSLIRKETPSARAGYLVATTGAFYAQYLFGFIVVIQSVHLLAIRARSRVALRRWAETLLLLVLLWLPAASHITRLFLDRRALNWVAEQRPITNWPAPLRVARQFVDPWALLAACFVILAVRLATAREARPRDPAELNLVALWLLGPLVCFSLIPPLFAVQLLDDRYVLFMAPAAVLLVAWILADLGATPGWRWVPLIAFLALTLARAVLPALLASGAFARFPSSGQSWREVGELINTLARDGDVVLVRSGFIRADRLADSGSHPFLRDGNLWPLKANLAPGRGPRLLALPYRLDESTRPYCSRLMAEAARHRRVWLLGKGPVIAHLAEGLTSGSGFRLWKRVSYPDVSVIALERTGP